MKKNEAILLNDLPLCPKGRIFKIDINGDYYHHMSDDEIINDKFKFYVFTEKEILTNSSWFKVIK
jgi:hypothetical protein